MLRRIMTRKCVFCRSTLRSIGAKSRRFSTAVLSPPKICTQTERWNNAVREGSELVQSGDETEHVGTLSYLSKENKTTQLLQRFHSVDHPVVNSAKQFLYDSRLTYQIHGLIGLLFAKALGHTPNSSQYKESVTGNGITEHQQQLAEALELHKACLILHTNLLTLCKDKDGILCEDLVKTNGFTVRLGNYFSAKAIEVLCGIGCNEVMAVVSSGVIDFTKSYFIGEVDKNSNFLPDKLSPLSMWQTVMSLSHASLLGKGCQGMAILGGHKDDVQMRVYECVTNMALAMKINKDLQLFKELSIHKPTTPFSLELAPVIMHLNSDAGLVHYVHDYGKHDINSLDFLKLLHAVKSGTAEEKTVALLEEYISESLKSLRTLTGFESKAAQILEEMLNALRID